MYRMLAHIYTVWDDVRAVWSLCESGKGLVVVCGVFTEPVQCCGEAHPCDGQISGG